MKLLIKNFEIKVINEINDLKSARSGGAGGGPSIGSGNSMPELQSGGCNGGRWYHWGEKLCRVPSEWSFPQMTLRGALHRYFLPDTKNEICATRHFHACDVANIKNGKIILSGLHHLMKFMMNELKKKNKFYDKPTNEQIDMIY